MRWVRLDGAANRNERITGTSRDGKRRGPPHELEPSRRVAVGWRSELSEEAARTGQRGSSRRITRENPVTVSPNADWLLSALMCTHGHHVGGLL